MRISSLRLEQFRSYDRVDVAFEGRGIELFVGPNGSGKTNVVEALSYLSTGRSCLGIAHENAVKWGTDYFRLRATLQRDSGQKFSIEFVSQLSPRKERAAFLNDVRVSFVQFIGQLPTIIFLPQDLDLFTGSPQRRRGFLDAIISQLQPTFLASRIEFERILKQRNALLKRIGEGVARVTDLDPWDEQLVLCGAVVQLERVRMVEALEPLSIERLQLLGESWPDARLRYMRSTIAIDERALASELRVAVRASRHKDIMTRSTSVGPHRDDWHAEADGRDIALFASRGQQRSCLLALLMSATDIFQSRLSERPLVILDDVFSELDDHHQQSLMTALEGSQVLLTSTHVPPTLNASDSWHVHAGVIERQSSACYA